jgi:hypothetical protein
MKGREMIYEVFMVVAILFAIFAVYRACEYMVHQIRDEARSDTLKEVYGRLLQGGDEKSALEVVIDLYEEGHRNV